MVIQPSRRALVSQPSRRTAAVLVAFSLVLIGLATLMPAETSVTLPASCVFCGQFGGVDFALNVVLFIPLGIGLRWLLGSWIVPAMVGASATLLIETLQWRLIPGRDASLGDLLANTLGTLVGVWLATTGMRWLNSTGSAARWLTVAWGALVVAVVLTSSRLLIPFPTRYPQWVQWKPQRPNMDVFNAELRSVEVNGAPVGPRDILLPARTIDTVTQGVTLRLAIEGATPPTARRAYIVRITNTGEEGFALSQRGDALVFRTNLFANRLKLHSIAVRLPNALPSQDQGSNGEPSTINVHANSSPAAMTVASDGPGQLASVELRRTVGLGWAMFMPWDIAIGPAWWPANALWLAAMMLPLAFFAGRSAGRTPDEGSRGRAWWPLMVVVATIAIAPTNFGLALPGPGEWIGVVLGIVAGLSLSRHGSGSDSELSR